MCSLTSERSRKQNPKAWSFVRNMPNYQIVEMSRTNASRNLHKLLRHRRGGRRKICKLCGSEKDLQFHHAQSWTPDGVLVLCRQCHHHLHVIATLVLRPMYGGSEVIRDSVRHSLQSARRGMAAVLTRAIEHKKTVT
jgi:hypothetical protein